MWPTSELTFLSSSATIHDVQLLAKCVSNTSSWVFFWRLLCLEYILKIFNLLSESYLQSSSHSQFMVNTFEKFHTSFIKSLRPQGKKKYVCFAAVRQLVSSGGKIPSRHIHNSNYFRIEMCKYFSQILSRMFSICPLAENLSSQILLQTKIKCIINLCFFWMFPQI